MDEIHWHWGPFAFLKVGAVWGFDVGRFRVYGVGRSIAFRRVNGE